MKYLAFFFTCILFFLFHGSANASTGTTNTGLTTATGGGINCLITSIEKRESALRNALREYNTAVEAVYLARTPALTSAYRNISDTDIRDATVRSTWKKWRSGIEAAKKKRRDTHRVIWKTYTAELKTCGILTKNSDVSYSGWDSGN